MIARHSFEQSSDGEGVEVVANEQVNDEVNGQGQYTEKRIHLSRSEIHHLFHKLLPSCYCLPTYCFMYSKKKYTGYLLIIYPIT